MNNYNWEILDIIAENEVIKSAKYHVTASDESNTYLVETEGNWYFNGVFDKPYLDITKEDVINLIKKESVVDGLNIIESRLDEQLAYLENNKNKNIAPWLSQTFTPNS